MQKPTLNEVKQLVLELISLVVLIIVGIKVVLHELAGLWAMLMY